MRLVTLALIAASAGFAATPDLTGNWKLNIVKSDFEFPPPSSLTQKVTHAEPKLAVEVKIVGDQGESAYTDNYTTDGKECSNQGPGGSEVRSVLKWDGDTLLIDSKGDFEDNPYTMKDKWTLSEGGKVLTIQRKISRAKGDVDEKLVFDKR